jgi:uncharacterized protein YidB (DUF937 family)
MDLMKMGAELFANASGGDKGGLDMDAIQSAMSGLLGGQGDKLDLGKIMSNMNGDGGMMSVVNSWLGDGENAPISADQITSLLGSDKVAEFASKLNIDPQTALNGLSQSLPGVVDKASSGGSLLDSFGGVSGLMDSVGKLFK